MKRESFYAKTNRSGNLLHVETDGCVVNVYVGLTDAEGRQVTRVDVSADGESRGGDGQGRIWLGNGSVGIDGGTVILTRQERPDPGFSVGETVVVRDTRNDLDAIGDITAIDGKYAEVDIDGALHRVPLASIRPL